MRGKMLKSCGKLEFNIRFESRALYEKSLLQINRTLFNNMDWKCQICPET